MGYIKKGDLWEAMTEALLLRTSEDGLSVG